MATSGPHPITLPQGRLLEDCRFCSRCRRVLPIENFMKNGVVLVTCCHCRSTTQAKRRDDRRKLAEYNAKLAQAAPPTRTDIPHIDRDGHTLLRLPPDVSDAVTPTASPTTERTESSSSETASSLSISENGEDMVLSRRGSAAIKALDLMKETIDIISHWMKKGGLSSYHHFSKESTTSSIKCEDVDNQDVPSDEEGSKSSVASYFVCDVCAVPRSTELRYGEICVYCVGEEQKYCVQGGHEAARAEFFDSDNFEHDTCKDCEGRFF